MFRPCDRDRDRPHLDRIWKECGWFVDASDEVRAAFLGSGPAWVGTLGDDVEALALGQPGSMRFGAHDLPLGLVAAVNTGVRARRRGLATRVTARLLATQAERSVVSILGVFDQGFYDRLGFGAGANDVMWSFDPAQLSMPVPAQVPVRLTSEDCEEIHASRLRRWRCHGSLVLDDPGATLADLCRPGSWGLGLRQDGRLTTFVWFSEANSRDLGVQLLAFEDRQGLADALGLIRSLADQVERVRMLQPAGIQLQPLLSRPWRHVRLTETGSKRIEGRAFSWWQVRLLQLEPAIALWPSSVPAFQLELSDPVTRYLPEASPWRGLEGDWVVDAPAARRGTHQGLPVLKTSVASFSRLWLGVAGARELALTGELRGDPALIEALDTLPARGPCIDWDV